MAAGKPKGYPKTGGRPKGTSYAGKLRQELIDQNIDLPAMFFEELSKVLEPHKRCELILKFMEFTYPKPRVDVAVSVKDMEPAEFKEMMRDGVARIRSEQTNP